MFDYSVKTSRVHELTLIKEIRKNKTAIYFSQRLPHPEIG